MSDKWLWTEALSKLSASGRAHPHQFDIHGGGIDLVFPHHENEIAQSRSAFRTPAMANFWMHNGFLQVEGEKMSKSLGNFVTINQLLHTDAFGGRAWPGEVLRLAMLRTHYRQPIDWTLKALEDAERTWREWQMLASAIEKGVLENLSLMPHRPLFPTIEAALCDDLNTPLAITEIHKLRNAIVHDHGTTARTAFTDAVRFFNLYRDDYSFVAELSAEQKRQVESMVAARSVARAKKDFAESDRIRDELAKMGVVLKDTKDRTTWEIAR